MNLTLAKLIDRWGGMLACRVLAGLRLVREAVLPRTELVEPRTILLVKFWGLGNIVLLLPVVRLLRKRWPEARLVFVSLARNRELLDACDELDERIYVDDRNALVLVATLIAAVLRAARRHPDLCVDFEQFARASLVVAVLARTRQIVGLDTPGQNRGLLLHKSVPYDDTQHMGQTYLDLARAAGVPEKRYRPEAPPLSDAGRAAVRELLGELADGAGPLVVLHPGSGDNFQGRRWPADAFARLARRLVDDDDARVVVTGTRAESALTARVVRLAERPGRVLDAGGRLRIAGLTALLEGAAALVTNDTAPVHFGSALGIPVFAFFGPNTPRLYGPLSRGSHAFYRALPCSPCLTNMNYKTSLCRMPVCIRDISVEEVELRVRAHLADLRAPGAAVLRTGS